MAPKGNSFFAKNRVADPELAEDGAWVFGAYDGKIDIKVRRAKSQYAIDTRRRLYKPYENFRKIPDARQDELNKRWVAEGLLIDWRKAEKAQDAPPAFSVEAALQAFEDDPDFLDEVVFFATKAETFRKERIEDDAKNSETPSAGS